MARHIESRVTKYYRILKTYNNYRNTKSKRVCQLCFMPDCDHDYTEIKRNEALECLTYWVSIAAMEAKEDMEWLDDDIIVPKFPTLGIYDPIVKYSVFPRLNLPISIVHVTDKPAIFTNSKSDHVDLPRLTVKATHYGYILYEQFYVLKSFRHGYFYNTKGKMKKVVDIPDNSFVIGFHHLQTGKVPYDEFVKTACVT